MFKKLIQSSPALSESKYLAGFTSAVFIAAGCLHFAKTSLFAAIVPPGIPAPQTVVYLSGVAEIAGGLGLMLRPVRKFAAVGLALLLAAVFPANYYMASSNIQILGRPIPRWMLWARLPLQLPLIWWVLCFAKTAQLDRRQSQRRT